MIMAVQMGNTKRENLLSSWKEIAAYLDCDIRTCQRWEKKFQLPVCRVDEESGSRVYAYKDELDEWLKSRNNKNSSPSKAKSQKLKQQIRLFVLLPLIIVGGFIIHFLFLKTSISPVPSDFRIQNSNLVILNEDDKELWRYDTGIENLVSEEEYRKHFQVKRYISKGTDRINLPQLMIKDIDNDKHKEVLFCTQTQTQLGEGKLFCFNHKGKILWDFESGRELKYGEKIYAQDYRIYGFEAIDLNHDGTLEIVVIAYHYPDFPTQLVVLNSDGKIIGEYWNSGQLKDLVSVDLEEDGRMEIVMAAMNNEYARPSLIVFDALSIRGSSPQKKNYYKCKDLEAGTEKYYILFPQVDIALLDALMESLSQIDVLKNKRLAVTASICRIIYEFDFKLRLQNIRLSHGTQIMHKKAVSEGKVTSVLNEDYKNGLEKDFLYFDGKKWVLEPTMNNNWDRSKN
jgi:hypothetical protein